MARARIPELEKQVEELTASLNEQIGENQNMVLELESMRRERNQFRAMIQAAINETREMEIQHGSPSVQ